MSRNIMVDIEALGTAPGSVVISIGACYFDPIPLFDDTFKVNIDTFDSLMHGLTVDTRTCKWWANQSLMARDAATSKPMGLLSALDQFSQFVKKDDYVWAKGPDFDLVLIQELYRMVEEPIPWAFRNTRDVRTIMHLAKLRTGGRIDMPRDSSLLQHDALDDAIHQARVVEKCAKILEVSL